MSLRAGDKGDEAGARTSYTESLWYRFGMTPEDYDRMFAAQDGKCATCGKEPTAGRAAGLHVDHDHATGAVRGLLCLNCNLALGRAKDDVNILRKMIAYLEHHAAHPGERAGWTRGSPSPWARERPVTRIRDPSGQVIEITNLTKFSRDRGLNPGGLWNVANGRRRTYKGYTAAS